MNDYYKDSTHLVINEYPQLFLDNLVIEQVQDVTRRWHQPQKDEAGPVLQKDKSWEHVAGFSWSDHTVLRDPADGLIKCWYDDLDMILERYPFHPVGHHVRQLYACSEDGIHFIKPEFDICPVNGQKTNILLGSPEYGEAHTPGVVIDPHPPTPDQRFRLLFNHYWEDSKGGHSRIQCAHSADGIHWKHYSEFPSFGMSGPNLNDCSILFYDEDARQFVQNTRHYLQWAGSVNLRNPYTRSFNGPRALNNWALQSQRRVWQSRSSDFIHWSEPVLVAMADDDEDNLDESYYGMCQYSVGKLHLATVGVFRAVDNEVEVQLLMSHDGLRWRPTNKRQPFLSPRGPGHWDAYQVSISCPPNEMGDEIWFYHGGANCHHDLWMCGAEPGLDHPEMHDLEKNAYSLGIAKLRKDGYASLDANKYREGIVVTRALISLGTKLVINARCRPGGSIRVEVADRYNDVIPPCTKDQCDPFTGDSVAHAVTWGGSPQVPAANEERRVWRKLRFFLRDAELFSFRFTDSIGRPLGETDKQGTGVAEG